jgi:putative ubiquitin-RnfH superfamily antitoxin RatB of RatAB toxin-antitoxin module
MAKLSLTSEWGIAVSKSHQRLSVYLPLNAADRLRDIAIARGMGVNDVMRLALGLLDMTEQARLQGHYVGIASDRENLDTVMVVPI